MTLSLPSITRFLVRSVSLLLLLLGTSLLIQGQTIRYVKPTATGNGSGSSWANASGNLQAMINTSGAQQIWVAGGRYTRTNSGGSFAMKNNVAIYGGFVGNESQLSQRPGVNPVAGQLSSTTLTVSTSGPVISNSALVNPSLLDGVVITGGTEGPAGGGGIYNSSSSPTLTNCLITGNSASQGGGIYYVAGRPTLINSVITGNSASQGGGAFGLNGSLTLTNCLIMGNSASQGGGIYNADSDSELTNCTLTGNTASDQGGGIYNKNGAPRLTNCLLANNTAANQGGAFHNFKSFSWLINCTLTGNSAGDQGGAISEDFSASQLTNSILFNNGGVKAFRFINGDNTRLIYSLIEPGATGYTSSPTNQTATTSPFVGGTNYQLNGCSQAINAGDFSSSSINSGSIDLAGNPRFYQNGRIDIGAYEYQGTPSTPVAITQQPPSGSSVTAGASVSVPVSVSGTVSAYQWYKNNLNSAVSGQTSATLTLTNVPVSDAGSYLLVVTGACNSVTSTAFTLSVSNPTPTIAGLAATPAAVCAGSPVTFTATVGNVTDSYAYTLTSGSSPLTGASSNATFSQSLTPAGSGPQTFTLTVSANGGQLATATTSLTVNTLPTATILASPSITLTCSQTSVTLTGGGGDRYTFSGPGLMNQTGNQAVVNAAGLYSLTVANGSTGCFSTTSITISQDVNMPMASLVSSGPLSCTAISVTLTASPSGQTYQFSAGATQLGTSNQAVLSSPGLYSVTIVSGNGCTGVASLSVSQDNTQPVATLSASPSTTLSCTQTQLILSAGGGDRYVFAGPGIVSQEGSQALVNTAGVYSVTVTNSSTGCFSVTSITISQDNSVPQASLTSSGLLTCATSSVTLTASPNGLSYAFAGPGVVSQSGNQAIVNVSGTYSVTVSDGSNGCSSVASVNVMQDNTTPVATISASPSPILTCTQTSLTLTAGGGNAYLFSGPGVVSQSSNVAVVNASGTYSVTVTNTASGCFSVTSISISQDASAPVASLVSSGPLSCAVSSVTLTANPNGQSYQFSAGANQIGASNQATVTASGQYSVTVINGGNGCSSVASVSVVQDNAAPMVSIMANPSLTISQGQSATLTAQATGSTPPYGYYWSTGANTPSIVVSTAGPYSVTGTSANGCTGTASATLTVNPVVTAPFAITGVTTVDCTPILPNRFSISFTPRYSGLDGSPVSFSVTNELFPTTSPGPYTLQLYTDNPVITLEAKQGGATTKYTYDWLAACNSSTAPNTPPRVVMGIPAQTATVGQYFSYVIPEGTFTDTETPGSLRLSASGVPAGLSFSGATLSGVPASTVGSPFSVTITATDPGGLSVSTLLVLTVQPASETPPPTVPFAITGVTTISCTPVADRININFAPRYAGLNGQPIAFEVINELSTTTEPGPYSLTLYRDNPVITLRATQTGSGGPVTYVYNWLSACASAGQDNTPPRLNEPVGSQTAVVGQGYSLNLTNTFTDQETPDQITLSAVNLPAGLNLSGKFISGTPSVSGVSSVSLTATDGGGLSISTVFSFTVLPASTQPPTNPPTAPFSITGVTTVSCEVVSAGQRRVTFTPRYAGLDGSPVSFSVVNEMLPTTSPGPYTLDLYTDNPVISLRAVQGGVSASYSYGWLAACNPGARQAALVEVPLSVTVLGNPVAGETVAVEVRGAEGQSLQLQLRDERGHLVSEQSVGKAGVVERQTLRLGQVPAGVLLLRVSTSTQSQRLKLLKAE